MKINLYSLTIALVLTPAYLSQAQTLFAPGGTLGNSGNTNVGIGISSPTQKLDVAGILRMSGNVSAPNDAGASYLWNQGFVGPTLSGYQFDVQTGSTGAQASRLRVDFSGNLGLGTTAPTEQLHLNANQSINFKAYNYAFLGTDYSSWSTILGNNVRARHGMTSGMELASGVLSSGGTAIRLNWGTIEFHAAGAPDIAGFTEGTAFSFPKMVLKPSGNVGIGTINPTQKLEVTGVICSSSNPSAPNDASASYWWNQANIGPTVSGYQFDVQTGLTGAQSSRFRIDPNGNVGIGTTTPTQKLSVNGTVRAKEIIVDTGWPDYVFAKDYKLASLSEVEKQIAAEGHLSGVPSAQEVSERGVNLGTMEAKLLAKIEELTLHQIEQEKRLAAQQSEIVSLSAEVASLKKP